MLIEIEFYRDRELLEIEREIEICNTISFTWKVLVVFSSNLFPLFLFRLKRFD